MTGTGTGTDMYMYSMLPAVYSTGLYYSGWMISVVVCLRDAQPVSTKDRRISTIVLTAYHRFYANYGLLHRWFAADCSLWSLRAQRSHSERSRWSR